MDANEEFESNLEKIIQDVRDVTQQVRMLREYRAIPKSAKIFKEYEIYFDTMYSYLYNYVILSFFKLYESGKDCISIYTLKRSIERNFEKIFTAPQHHVESPKTKKMLLEEIKSCLFPVKQTIEKIQHIRNKAGLAHAIPNDFTITISFEELEKLTENTQQIVNCVYQRYQETTYLFNEACIYPKSLQDLAKEYEKVSS